ncbi:unnamed protein product [Prorocentrum cordatum]|uniref:Phosphoribosyl-AMP cyclohydrolase n=1 Tax=Prorocentrum cordatum TaxID=2364126 RepID=A0ABN9UTQ5_9DINO|nr:unnamed protein product [Polarella glacialis]
MATKPVAQFSSFQDAMDYFQENPENEDGTDISEEQVLAAQKEWGDGIVNISAIHERGGDYEAAAKDLISKLYGYGVSPVLFKPTLARDSQFRSTFEDAVSYFVATNGLHEEDTGFAIKGWKAVRWDNKGVNLFGNTALAMGNYFFTNPEGEEVKVEYTFGYFIDSSGAVRINLHHSSVPFVASRTITREQVLAAQKAWGDGIVRISAIHAVNGDYETAASTLIKKLYGYGVAPVLFKPTLANDVQFRSTFEDALSYFVATESKLHSEDTGFAIKGWKAVRWENTGINMFGESALAMGNYYFTTPEGEEVKVEYTFGYILDAEGEVRINLHHSSVPYPVSKGITKQQIREAQRAWGDAIVNISALHANGGDFRKAASEHIKKLYGYASSPVLFKPAMTATDFCFTFEEALSHFVTTEEKFPGLAIQGWKEVRCENTGVSIHGSTAMAMGNCCLTTPEGKKVKLDYTFGYILNAEGDIRINLHHMSTSSVS